MVGLTKRNIQLEVKKFKKSLESDFAIIESRFAKEYAQTKKANDDTFEEMPLYYVHAYQSTGFSFEDKMKEQLKAELRQKFHSLFNEMIDNIVVHSGESKLNVLKIIKIKSYGVDVTLFNESVSDEFLDAVETILDDKVTSILVNAKSPKANKGEDKNSSKLFSAIAKYLDQMQGAIKSLIKDLFEKSIECLAKHCDDKVAQSIAKGIFGKDHDKILSDNISVLNVIKEEMSASKSRAR